MVMSSSSTTSRNGSQSAAQSNPEVREKAQRRIYTAEYKLRILQETDTCQEGQIGAILRREGLYSSHLTTWRRQRQAGQLAALRDDKRGRKAVPANPLSAQVERLQQENQRLSQQLAQAELVIEIQKKASMLLNMLLERNQCDDNEEWKGHNNLRLGWELLLPVLD